MALLLRNFVGSRRLQGEFRRSLFRLVFDRNAAIRSIPSIRVVVIGRRTISVADGFQSKLHTQLIGYILVDGTGVCQFFRHSHIG